MTFGCEYLLIVKRQWNGEEWYDCDYHKSHGDRICKTRECYVVKGCPMAEFYGEEP